MRKSKTLAGALGGGPLDAGAISDVVVREREKSEEGMRRTMRVEEEDDDTEERDTADELMRKAHQTSTVHCSVVDYQSV